MLLKYGRVAEAVSITFHFMGFISLICTDSIAYLGNLTILYG